jgi:hypothetical protein
MSCSLIESTQAHLLWENTLKNPGDDGVNDLVVAGQRVFIGGVQTNARVKAYDALTRRFQKKPAGSGRF